MTLITCLICNLLTRKCPEAKSRDHLHDVTNQLHLSRGISSLRLNFIPYAEVEKIEGAEFFRVRLGQ